MTRGQHGTGEIGRALGPVSGWVVDGVYIAGDTILLRRGARGARALHQPRATIVNGGGARFLEGDPIVMTAAEVAQLDGTVVVVHLEAINHCLEPRVGLRRRDRAAQTAKCSTCSSPIDGTTTSASASASSSGG